MDKKQFWDDLKSGVFVSMVKESSKGRRLMSPKEVYNVMKPMFAEKDDIERMYCIFLNSKNRIIAIEKLSDGTINHAVIYPREVIKMILKLKATAIILVHNHPSGDTEPSPTDKEFTIKIAVPLSSMDVQLHDHMIIGNGYYSMADAGDIQEIKTRMRELILA
jgi:DNA repair protein RadC